MFFLLLTVSIVSLTSCAANTTEPRNFIALGDSVAYGYGLASVEESYSAVFYTMLINEGYNLDGYTNLAVNGFTTAMLMDCLNSIDEDSLNLIRNAYIITLNIGGNNILVPFSDYMSKNDYNTSGFFGMFSDLPELMTALQNGADDFTNEFKEIISWLNINAPSATIIVNTIFNTVPEYLPWMSDMANTLLAAINDEIFKLSKAKKYLVADIYSNLVFDSSMFDFNLDPSTGDISFDFVHPNAIGHDIIAKINYNMYNQCRHF